MSLAMKTTCEKCDRALSFDEDAYICSYECTYCPNCHSNLLACPNCGGELVRRPIRQNSGPAESDVQTCVVLPPSDVAMPYRPRLIQPVKVHPIGSWQLKVYWISSDSTRNFDSIIQAALEYIETNVAWPVAEERFGFVTVHAGEQAVWVHVDQWFADIMRHFVFCASVSQPTDFEKGPADGTNSCVWELEITRHERDAWVNHVLMDPANPDYAGYLNDVLEVIPTN